MSRSQHLNWSGETTPSQNSMVSTLFPFWSTRKLHRCHWQHEAMDFHQVWEDDYLCCLSETPCYLPSLQAREAIMADSHQEQNRRIRIYCAVTGYTHTHSWFKIKLNISECNTLLVVLLPGLPPVHYNEQIVMGELTHTARDWLNFFMCFFTKYSRS